MTAHHDSRNQAGLPPESETCISDRKEFHRLLDDPNSTPTQMIEAYYKVKKSYTLDAEYNSGDGITTASPTVVDDLGHDLGAVNINGHDQGSNPSGAAARPISELDRREDAAASLRLKEWQESEEGKEMQRKWDEFIIEKNVYDEWLKTTPPMYSSEELDAQLRAFDFAKHYNESREAAIKKDPKLAEWYQLADVIAKGPMYAKRKREAEAKEAAAALAKTAAAERSKSGKGKGKK